MKELCSVGKKQRLDTELAHFEDNSGDTNAVFDDLKIVEKMSLDKRLESIVLVPWGWPSTGEFFQLTDTWAVLPEAVNVSQIRHVEAGREREGNVRVLLGDLERRALQLASTE